MKTTSTKKRTSPKLRVSKKYKEVEFEFKARGYSLVLFSTQYVAGYQFHASKFSMMTKKGKSFLVIHNPDGIATCEELTRIEQDDHNRSPMGYEIIAAM